VCEKKSIASNSDCAILPSIVACSLLLSSLYSPHCTVRMLVLNLPLSNYSIFVVVIAYNIMNVVRQERLRDQRMNESVAVRCCGVDENDPLMMPCINRSDSPRFDATNDVCIPRNEGRECPNHSRKSQSWEIQPVNDW
jgi:hypothetical protein